MVERPARPAAAAAAIPAGPPPSTTTSYSPRTGVSRRSSTTNIQSHYAFESEVRSARGARGEARGRNAAPALAAGARGAGALRDRMAGALGARGARADLSLRARRRRLAPHELPRDLRRGAAHRPGPARSQARRRAPGGDPVGQRHRSRAARARRDACRRTRGADLAGVLAAVEGLRQAEADLRAAAAGDGLRRRPGQIRTGARGRELGLRIGPRA